MVKLDKLNAGQLWDYSRPTFILTHTLKPPIYGTKIGQKVFRNGQNYHYNGVSGFICLNDILRGPKDSRGFGKVQGNTKSTFGPNSIVEVWLKMAKISQNEGLSIVYNLLILGSIYLNVNKLQAGAVQSLKN